MDVMPGVPNLFRGVGRTDYYIHVAFLKTLGEGKNRRALALTKKRGRISWRRSVSDVMKREQHNQHPIWDSEDLLVPTEKVGGRRPGLVLCKQCRMYQLAHSNDS